MAETDTQPATSVRGKGWVTFDDNNSESVNSSTNTPRRQSQSDETPGSLEVSISTSFIPPSQPGHPMSVCQSIFVHLVLKNAIVENFRQCAHNRQQKFVSGFYYFVSECVRCAL